MDIASISISGLAFLRRDRIRVESTPPLNAMHTFRIFEELSFLDILSSKEEMNLFNLIK